MLAVAGTAEARLWVGLFRVPMIQGNGMIKLSVSCGDGCEKLPDAQTQIRELPEK
jgi:hypothetical protein